MKLTDTITQALELDTYHALEHLIAIGMRKMEHHDLSYHVFEKSDKIYYFELADNELLRLYCVTSKKSFYLS